MRIACIGDVHYNSMYGRTASIKAVNRIFYQRFFSTFFSLDADLYVCLGDLTHFGTSRQLREIFAIIEEAKKPDQRFQPVIGNHDILLNTKRKFLATSGLETLYRAEDYDDVRVLYLDTARVASFRKNSSLMSIDQSRWLCQEMLRSGEKPVIVFAHHPSEKIRMTDSQGRYLTHLSVKNILELKTGTGIYVNGHKHRDDFHVNRNWAYLQFNDILDEPIIRVLTIKNDGLSMVSVPIMDPWMQRATDIIARHLLTFVKRENNEEFADVSDLEIQRLADETAYHLICEGKEPSAAPSYH